MRMRYYYTDPLAAAWMAKHFGMRYCVSKHGHFELNHLVEDEQLEIEDWCEDETFYIHPDSLHLLEPVERDAIDFTTPKGDLLFFKVNLGMEDNARLLISQGAKIIQRNGLAFMLPEEEQCT